MNAIGRLAAGLGLLAAAGCVATPVQVGRAAYQDNCSACHGARGTGDGTMAVFVSGGVPNLRGLAARNGGDFPEAHVVRVITRVSDLHEGIVAMPDFGALLDASPTVYTAPDGERIRTDATVLAIADYLESIQD
ncbi:MAG: cytochrome c [Rhodobacter sp.]|nr:cytochrome c [Rhodobacter sp.]